MLSELFFLSVALQTSFSSPKAGHLGVFTITRKMNCKITVFLWESTQED